MPQKPRNAPGNPAKKNPHRKNGASGNSNVTCAVSCIMQLVCAHTWLYNIRWSSRKRSASGQARKLRCDAVWRVLNLKNDGTRYREAPRRGRSLTRLRQEARMIQNIAITRIVKRWHKYNAKCSALPQQISQEMFGGRQCTGPGVYCCSASRAYAQLSSRQAWSAVATATSSLTQRQ